MKAPKSLTLAPWATTPGFEAISRSGVWKQSLREMQELFSDPRLGGRLDRAARGLEAILASFDDAVYGAQLLIDLQSPEV